MVGKDGQMDGLVSEVVFECRGRQVPVHVAIALSDLRLVLALPFCLLLAWAVPERQWPRPCGWVLKYLRRASPLDGAIRAASHGAVLLPVFATRKEGTIHNSITPPIRLQRNAPRGWGYLRSRC